MLKCRYNQSLLDACADISGGRAFSGEGCSAIESLEFPFVAGGCWYSGRLSQRGRVGGVYRRVPAEVEFKLPEKTSSVPVLYSNMVGWF